MTKFICPNCKKEFFDTDKRKYCSNQCRYSAGQSPEHRAKISKSHTGKKLSNSHKLALKEAWARNKNRNGFWLHKKRGPQTKEWRENIGKANKGKIRTKEYCEYVRKRMLGRKMSDETKINLSNALKGKKGWNTGMKFPFKERPNAKGHIPWNKGITGVMKAWNKGKKFPPMPQETRDKIRAKLKGRISPTKGIKISKEHIEALRKSRLGIPNLWKGGKYIDGFGYVKIFRPEHPMAQSKGYVLEHRIVMEEHIGRYLTREEVVHHKGTKFQINSIENKSDNRIENLELCASEYEHRKYHKKLRRIN